MISLPVVQQRLQGALALAFGREDWRERFDFSADGFFQSFWAVLLAWPIQLVNTFVFNRAWLAMDPEASDAAEAGFQLLSVSAVMLVSVAYFMEFTAVLVTIAGLTRFLRVADRFTPAVIAYNWSHLLISCALALAALAHLAIQSPQTTVLAVAIVAIWGLTVNWRVFRESLGLNVSSTLAAVVLVLLVGGMVSAMMGAAASALFAPETPA